MKRSDPARRQGRILLVEDDADAAYYAVHVLTRMGGFEVSHTPDPAVALQRACALPWDLVLTDVDLPGMTGSELIGALRQAVPALPVAVMTARAAADPGLDVLRRQADALLHKPVPPNRLLTIVSLLVEERSSRDPGARLFQRPARAPQQVIVTTHHRRRSSPGSALPVEMSTNAPIPGRPLITQLPTAVIPVNSFVRF